MSVNQRLQRANPKLSNDVIEEILLKLPVKSLLRFRCVSKSWNSLISSSRSAKSHLRNSERYSSFTTHRIMLYYFDNTFKHCSFNSLLYEPIVEPTVMDYLVQFSRRRVTVVGSCNGLICLEEGNDLLLWNPCTGKCKMLAGFGLKEEGSFIPNGFGYDKASDDYKVVGFLNPIKSWPNVTMEVYSVKTGQWGRIDNCKLPVRNKPATFANGKLYWPVKSNSELGGSCHIAFIDLETEVYGVLQTPDHVNIFPYTILGSTEGRLVVVCKHLTVGDVWIMDDFGIGKESWTKVAAIPVIDDYLRYSFNYPLYVLENGDILMLCGSKVMVFNKKDGSLRHLEIADSDSISVAWIYMESLVSPFM